MSSEIFAFLYQYAINLHLYHFQTENYAGHRTSDMHLERFRDNLDTLLEVYQGKFGRLKVRQPYQIEVNNVKKTQTIVSHTLSLNKYLSQLREFFQENDDLISIVDEMVADNNQFIYLLSFQ